MAPRKYSPLRFILFAVFISLFFSPAAIAQHKQKYVIIGYAGGRPIDTTMINPMRLTHLNYAFVSCQHNRAVLSNPANDTVNFKYLVSLKKRNPDLKILISIGGWGGCRYFSDAALTDTSRDAFAASAVDIVSRYQLDGVDIDWEYPDDIGANNIFRAVDKYNYTLLFKAIRKRLDSVASINHHQYQLTAAVGGFKRFLLQTDMGEAQKYLDYVSLMTYDYSQDSLHMSIHHTNLYPSKKYTLPAQNSVYQSVVDFEAAGVPASKLVIGIAFYGRGEGVVAGSQNGIGEKMSDIRVHGGGYTYLKDSLVNKKGYTYYRDDDAKAPYLFNSEKLEFITFDDEWSVENKCKFVKKYHLAGAMFWDYNSDRKEYLLKEIDKELQ